MNYKNELITVWYHAIYMVTENGARREYPIYTQGNSEIDAAVRAAVSITESNSSVSNVTFKSIRIASYHEADTLDAELDAIAEEENKNE
ncbi:hypothetical protein AT03_15385 [Hafnia alvei FB1]|jgi:hypothetical protein|uniref:Uncharacterized protein n=1 Tax=Hafnia alvei FB1 TaxID=1453496 RepID=A0A097R4K9_HAFAL|nr:MULTISPECIES: hypothetical protein [Hafnia]AIU73638.1 hypothetical protein AT03_15385 [Hafnia alvei FB1]MDX6839861.1 hypothetical protein [Hafnia paralvei]QBJ33995.1 hypothetical protein EYZ02_14440 [Hafnia alvei]TBL62559.1 hypothetical protein EYY92_04760 [Hafnia alvei]